MKWLKNNKGFTLVEMMLVLVASIIRWLNHKVYERFSEVEPFVKPQKNHIYFTN